MLAYVSLKGSRDQKYELAIGWSLITSRNITTQWHSKVTHLKAGIFGTLKGFTHSIDSMTPAMHTYTNNIHACTVALNISPVRIPSNILVYTLDTNLKPGTSIIEHVTG